MRAILIDTFNEQIREVDLPSQVHEFNAEIRSLLRTDAINIVHSNELLTVILDGAAVAKNSPAFRFPLQDEFPLFGNALLIGRKLDGNGFEDLYHEYKVEDMVKNVKWCDEIEAEHFRILALAYAQGNRK